MKHRRISNRLAYKSESLHEARRSIRRYGYVGAFERLFASIFRGAQ